MLVYSFLQKWEAVVRYEENDQKSTETPASGSGVLRNGSRWVWDLNYRPIPAVVFRLFYTLHDEEGPEVGNNFYGGSVNVMF